AERRRVADDVDRVVVDVAHDAGRPAIAPGREHAETGNEHDARQGVDQLDTRIAVGIDIGGVVTLEVAEAPLDRVEDGGAIVGAVEAYEARQALGGDGGGGRGGTG